MSEYVDGELKPQQQRRLAAHEEICPDCHRVVRTLRGMLARLRGLPAADPPPGRQVADDVLARISEEQS